MKKLRIAIAGTTQRTALCAETLHLSKDFELAWVLTPEPKPIGRKKILTANPLQLFAETHGVPVINLKTKISTSVKTFIKAQKAIDMLLVVDFGYFVPSWLLTLPTIAAINIHPSALPRWRGSSPGQFVLLYGEKTSAVTLIKMNETLDQGPIIASIPFAVDSTWNAEKYYAHSFALMCTQLPLLLTKYAQTRQESSQPLTSPTPTATKIQKQDAFIPWEYLEQAQLTPDFALSPVGAEVAQLSPLLLAAITTHTTFASAVSAAVRAFSPWPKVWTNIPTPQGKKRMQIHTADVQNTAAGATLQLGTVQVEGQSPAHFNQIKNRIKLPNN